MNTFEVFADYWNVWTGGFYQVPATITGRWKLESRNREVEMFLELSVLTREKVYTRTTGKFLWWAYTSTMEESWVDVSEVCWISEKNITIKTTYISGE